MPNLTVEGGNQMVQMKKDIQKEIVKLKVNFKTLEDFKSFKEYGIRRFIKNDEDLQA